MLWRLLVCILLGLMFPLLALADSLVVAGRAQQLASPVIVDGTEVLAPVLPALRLLGVVSHRQGSIIILTAADHTLKLKLDSASAEQDGHKLALGAAPREQDGDLYVPVYALGSFIDAYIHYQQETGTLTIAPLLNVSCSIKDDGNVEILARSRMPLQYTSGWLKDPARAYFDFKNTVVKGDALQFDLDGSFVQHVRASQFSTTPDTVRVVADCDAVRTFSATVGEQGRLVTITLIKDATATPAVITPQVETPQPIGPAGAPARLLDATLETLSTQQTQLSFTLLGSPAVASTYDEKTRQLTLDFPNTTNGIPDNRVQAISDRQVGSVTVAVLPDGGARAIITFKRDAGYLINSGPTGIQVNIGTFTLKDMFVVLDAGHGGHDTGAVGCNGTCEKDINLDIVLRAAKLLQAAGAKILLTRSDDTFIPLYDRPGMANTQNADIFIAVHCNSTPKRNTGKGTQIYFRTPQSVGLAAAIHTEMVKALQLFDGGIRNESFCVIRESKMPSVLIEVAFLNNEREEALLNTVDFRQRAAEGVLNGVRRYAAGKNWALRQSNLAEAPVTMTVAAR